MGKHDEAMEHNEKLLDADEAAAEGGDAEEAAGAPASAADALADQAAQLKARLPLSFLSASSRLAVSSLHV